MNHEQYVKSNPDLVRRNLAAAIKERDDALAKQQRARSEQGKRNQDGTIRFMTKMIARYEDDLRIAMS
jgi:hypothetical protein